MIVGPTKALFMDEISTGLDSSTTFQIVSCLQQLVHITDTTALVSLLQPAPETYNLFDDIILMAEGKIVYHGPRSDVLKFFEDCGFKCPERKGAADFLQEACTTLFILFILLTFSYSYHASRCATNHIWFEYLCTMDGSPLHSGHRWLALVDLVSDFHAAQTCSWWVKK